MSEEDELIAKFTKAVERAGRSKSRKARELLLAGAKTQAEAVDVARVRGDAIYAPRTMKKRKKRLT